jgi:hypothetical protein
MVRELVAAIVIEPELIEYKVPSLLWALSVKIPNLGHCPGNGALN